MPIVSVDISHRALGVPLSSCDAALSSGLKTKPGLDQTAQCRHQDNPKLNSTLDPGEELYVQKDTAPPGPPPELYPLVLLCRHSSSYGDRLAINSMAFELMISRI